MVYAIGKINDIFVGQGITEAISTKSNKDGIDKTIDALGTHTDKGLIFTNLVDFDAKFGHRNNAQGYADALTEFDQHLPKIVDALNEDDILVITADHGNDPTFPGTDHTREHIPVLIAGAAVNAGVNIGVRSTFSDLAATIADIFDVKAPPQGKSFKENILNQLTQS